MTLLLVKYAKELSKGNHDSSIEVEYQALD